MVLKSASVSGSRPAGKIRSNVPSINPSTAGCGARPATLARSIASHLPRLCLAALSCGVTLALGNLAHGQGNTLYWNGLEGNSWNSQNWSLDSAGTSTALKPTADTDVIFSVDSPGNEDTVLGRNFTIHSLTVNSSGNVTIGGNRTLTIDGAADTGITVNTGAGLFTIGQNAKLFLAGSSNRITVNNEAGAIIRGVVQGESGLVKDGTERLTLTGENTYTGGTIILAGTLRIGNGGTSGSILGDVLNYGILSFDRSDAVTFEGSITGTGSVRHAGSGTTTFTGDSDYGDLQVRNGQVILDGGYTTLNSSDSTPVTVGNANNVATLLIQNGAYLDATGGRTNLVTGLLGTSATLDNADWDVGFQLVIGRDDFGLGKNHGSVTVQNDGYLDVRNYLIVGAESGEGELFIQSGGQVYSRNGVIGSYARSSSLPPLREEFSVQAVGKPELIPSTGLVSVSGFGSQWFVQRNLSFGGFDAERFGGTGTLEVSDGGLVVVGRNTNFWTSDSSIYVDGGTFATGSLTNLAGTNPFIYLTDATCECGSSIAPALVVGLDNSDSTFSGTILDGEGGPGSLLKIGTGAFTLTGTNTYTGPTDIEQGSLIVDGSIASPDTYVGLDGLLGGHGFIGGQVVNDGIVSPGNSPGTLTIAGNYTQSSSGTLKIEIAGRSASQHDLLVVGGNAALNGKLQVVRLNNFQLQLGDHIVFLTAAGGVTGKFGTLENDFATGTTVSGKVVYSAKEVALEAVQESFVEVPQLIEEQFGLHYSFMDGLTPNQFAVANALDNLVKKRGSTKLIEYLNRRWLFDLPGDFDRIAPEELTAIFQAGVSYATIQSLNIQRRADDIRSGSNGFSAQSFALNGQTPSYSGGFGIASGAAGPTGDSSKDSKFVYTPTPDNKWGVFLSGTGEWIDVDGDGNARGFNVTTGGFTVGVDYKVTPNLAIGLSAGYAGTSADLTDNGRVWTNGGKIGLYGTFFTGGFYTDLAVNGGYNSYDTKRGGLEGTARGSTEGGELNVLFGTGYDFKIGALTVGPTATFNYTYIGFDSYTEHGSLAPLYFRDQKAESMRTAFGLKASYDWKLGGVLIKPELRASWQHEFADDDYALDASLPDAGGNTFNVRGPKIGRDSLLLSGGVAVQFNDRVATYLYYDGQIARENYDSHSVSGGIRVSF